MEDSADRVAALGECVIELSRRADGALTLSLHWQFSGAEAI